MSDEKTTLEKQHRNYGALKSAANLESVQLSWRGISVTHQKSGRVILDDVYGQAEPGELVALMGSSGAGKTTLLNTLLSRNLKSLNVKGEILVNKTSICGRITEISGYVQQEELFISTLTVKEHLNIQADLRLVGLMTSERRQRVNDVMRKLGLLKCKNTQIGSTSGRKGISGGETKRLLFASELLDNPPLLFCDEPTTGLDSAKAESVVNVMRKLAETGHTIICTIHQPSSSIFRKFDKNYNPADSIIETLSIESNREVESRERIDEICSKFRETADGHRLAEIVERTRSESLNREPSMIKREMAPIPLQIWSLLKRSLLDNYRNPALARAKLIQKNFYGRFRCTLFGILSYLPAEYPLVVREYHDSLYHLLSYYLARTISYIPLFTLDGVIMITIAYWMIGLTPTVYRFLIALGIGILCEQASAGFGVMLASCAPSYAVAVSIAGPLLSILSLTGGLYANIGELPAYISWFQYLSWFRYGFEAIAISQWVDVENKSSDRCILYTDSTNSTDTCLNADDIIQRFSFSRNNFALDIAVLLLTLTCTVLKTFWRAFRSKKWNPLKTRVDSVQLDSREMFIVTVLFLTTILLMPTVLVYFVVFYLLWNFLFLSRMALQRSSKFLRQMSSVFCTEYVD
ncbi:ATP-binding cassette sub-family G member 2 [Aphelenchoides besseyi]|nr:ATP-binding cassette sub-family G member 2 [Aphelenchoides besseyi]